MAVFDAPRGTGPYGIATAPEGQVFFASLAGNYLGRIDLKSGATATLGAARAGARRTARLERQPRWAVDHRLEQLRSFPL
jgi:virginiamycin B lyase